MKSTSFFTKLLSRKSTTTQKNSDTQIGLLDTKMIPGGAAEYIQKIPRPYSMRDVDLRMIKQLDPNAYITKVKIHEVKNRIFQFLDPLCFSNRNMKYLWFDGNFRECRLSDGSNMTFSRLPLINQKMFIGNSDFIFRLANNILFKIESNSSKDFFIAYGTVQKSYQRQLNLNNTQHILVARSRDDSIPCLNEQFSWGNSNSIHLAYKEDKQNLTFDSNILDSNLEILDVYIKVSKNLLGGSVLWLYVAIHTNTPVDTWFNFTSKTGSVFLPLFIPLSEDAVIPQGDIIFRTKPRMKHQTEITYMRETQHPLTVIAELDIINGQIKYMLLLGEIGLDETKISVLDDQEIVLFFGVDFSKIKISGQKKNWETRVEDGQIFIKQDDQSKISETSDSLLLHLLE